MREPDALKERNRGEGSDEKDRDATRHPVRFARATKSGSVESPKECIRLLMPQSASLIAQAVIACTMWSAYCE